MLCKRLPLPQHQILRKNSNKPKSTVYLWSYTTEWHHCRGFCCEQWQWYSSRHQVSADHSLSPTHCHCRHRWSSLTMRLCCYIVWCSCRRSRTVSMQVLLYSLYWSGIVARRVEMDLKTHTYLHKLAPGNRGYNPAIHELITETGSTVYECLVLYPEH